MIARLLALLAFVALSLGASAQVIIVKAGADGKVFEPSPLTLTAPLISGALTPATNDGGALGSASLGWSDLFLASGAVVNFANGNVTITHSSGVLTLGTSMDLRMTTAGTNAGSVVTVGGTQTLTAKTLTSPNITTGIAPTTDDGAALGDTTHNFSDLFLATGSVLNFANGNVAVTHSSGILTMGTGELRITSPGTNAASVPTLGSTSTLTNKTLTAPVATEAVIRQAVTAYANDGAITIASGIANLSKAGVGAYSVAAPSTQDGTRITFVNTTANAHVVTFTGGTLWDGTDGANTTATFAAFPGASITVVAIGVLWYVESLNAVTPAP